jgi:hypothetical protein
MNIEHLTSNRFTAWIGKPRAVIGQFLLPAKGVNPPKGKLLDAVTRPNIGSAEFGYPLDQSGQTRCHLRFPSLIIDKWGGYNCMFTHCSSTCILTKNHFN